MTAWIGPLGTGALLLLTSVLLVRAMIGIGIMDLPAGRKAHARPTPKAGGIGVIGACLAGALLLEPLRDSADWIGPSAGLLAALGLGMFGLADDLHERGAAAKLTAQCLAAMAAVLLGSPDWDVVTRFLALGWLVFATNVFNFMDGLDGLAGGTGLVVALVVALLAPPGGATQALALALAAGLAGFLPFNRPPARIFLGDTGSQFCGFLLAWLGLCLFAEVGTLEAAWLVPMLLGGMILDVVLTLQRRARAGARLTEAHREHFYQRCRWPGGLIALAHAGFALTGGISWLLLSRGWIVTACGGFMLPHALWLTMNRYRPRVPAPSDEQPICTTAK